MKEIHLQLDRLSVGYNKKALIHGIEIDIRRGEIVTLVGPNGSGKSTILKSITRQLPLVGGEIILAEKGEVPGEPCGRKSLSRFTPGELAQRMAVVLTGRLKTELMTCRDVVAMGRYPYTGRLGILSEVDEQKVEDALAAVHAQALSGRPFDAVSDGERQRILLARAICQEPEIIVLDEPTSYLDIRHKMELLSILYKMSREQNITVVMSLHEIDLAMKISDRVICVRGETIFACGKPSEVLDGETIRKLYDLDPALGSFDVRSGSLELRFAERQGRAEEPNADGTKEKEQGKRKVSLPRVMIAAPSSGSGKTLITCGLLRLLARRGLRPAAFKCGPDYIDPMFHRQVLGIPSENLDTFFLPGDSGRDGKGNKGGRNSAAGIMVRAAERNKAGIAVIEGVMGYFDGTGASGMQASSFDAAQQTGTPVVLVVNAKGMGRSVPALLKGFLAYEQSAQEAMSGESKGLEGKRQEHSGECESLESEQQEHAGGRGSGAGAGRIRGVILNCISAGMFPQMKEWIEHDTGLRVIGYVPRDESFSWGSRHLGLLQPEEVADLQKQVDHLADIMEETIDPDCLTEIAKEGAELTEEAPETGSGEKRSDGPRIAVARDEAFSFYYEDNLELLRECGAELLFFSPLHDRTFPEADGLLLGGGYPELHAQALSENEEMKAQIRARAEEGMPILAECGGFMYLQEYLETGGTGKGKDTGKEAGDNLVFPMCGVLPGRCRMTDHLVRFGYIELEKREGASGPAGYLSEGHRIRGHEFHYFDSTQNGDACTARKPGRKRAWDCMVVRGGIMAGFPHLYYRSDPDFAANFVRACLEARRRNEE